MQNEVHRDAIPALKQCGTGRALVLSSALFGVTAPEVSVPMTQEYGNRAYTASEEVDTS
jgi:hypothetical protein